MDREQLVQLEKASIDVMVCGLPILVGLAN